MELGVAACGDADDLALAIQVSCRWNWSVCEQSLHHKHSLATSN